MEAKAVEKIKRYDFSKKPVRPSKFCMALARSFFVRPRLRGRKLTVDKIKMEGVKPPYLLLPTHSSPLDYPVIDRAIAPHAMNCALPLDAVRGAGGLIRRLGGIPRRRFAQNPYFLPHLIHCAEEYKTVVCLHPEPNFSLDGTTAALSPSLGELCYGLKLPVVALRIYGSFVAAPQWNRAEQKLPLHAELECIATKDELPSLTKEELFSRVTHAMQRDDYAWQRERGIELKNPRRAQGLHNILYRCPRCNSEHKMYSERARLWCASCGKAWQMNTLSELTAEEGKTEFSFIPDWVKWERALLCEALQRGDYRFEEEVTVRTLPAKKFFRQGKGKLVQTKEGTRLICTAYGKAQELFFPAGELEGVHVEFGDPLRKDGRTSFGDCVDISTQSDSYRLTLHGRNRAAKLALATEELYRLAREGKLSEGRK